MNRPKHEFVNVDELSRRMSVEQVLAHFGHAHEIVHRVGNEIRTRCFLNCGKTEPTGDRVLAIQSDDVKRWCCHRYECPHKQGGNLVGLVDLLLPGANSNGRPRGERFKEVLNTLQQIAGETSGPLPAPARKSARGCQAAASQRAAGRKHQQTRPRFSQPAREVHRRPGRDAAQRRELLPSPALPYRRRGCGLAMGYLPRTRAAMPAAARSAAGSLPIMGRTRSRGRLLRSRSGFRDEARGLAQGCSARYRTNEGRISEGFAPRSVALRRTPVARTVPRERIQSLGTLLAVEGPNDAIRLGLLDVPALAVLSNRITEQADKLARWSAELGDVPITLLFDLDPEGESIGKRSSS